MSCPSCGQDLEPGARFCGLCGHRLAEPAPPAPAPAAPGDPYIGTVLNNRFVIEAKLGEGGFGAVYRGEQKGVGRKVALKLLHPEMTRDTNLVERFRREGLVMCNLRDAHTITTYDFDQTAEGTLYIAMELLEGRSLHEVFHEDAPIAWQRMIQIVAQMCSSLHEAHAQGIVHRDLKPENIHLENRPGNPEFVKVLDFGIAKVVQGEAGGDPKSPQLTATGQTLGTLEYMSPEQLMGKQLDGRSDVYALGVLTYEMITGRLPFPDAKGPAGLITAQLRQVPDPPSRANPAAGIPPAVDRVVLRMLEKDKGKRFDGVDALSVACKALLASEGRSGGPVIDADLSGETTPLQSRSVAAAPPAPAPAAPAPAPAAPAPAPAPAPAAARAPGPPGPDPAFVRGAAAGPSRVYRPPGPTTDDALAAASGSRLWLWIALAIVIAGGAVGALLALQ